MFFPTLIAVSSIIGLTCALPIHYQSSFDITRFTISTPDELHQCTPSSFSWTPTTGPYYLSITTSNNGLQPQYNSGETVVVPHASSASWIVDVEEGSLVTVEVRDSRGQVAETVVRTVMAGPEHCL